MARWMIDHDLTVTYQDSRGVQPCGKPESPTCTFDDVLGWAACAAEAGDFVVTAKGLFHVTSSNPIPC